MTYGSGTVQPNWQQAQNLVNQQVNILVTELTDAERRIRAAELGRKNAEAALASFKARPDTYSEGWYVKELGKERERRQLVESNLRRQTEFGKLKDRAKIKVEMTRDQALRQVDALTVTVDLLKTQVRDTTALKIANEQQAIAWKRAVEETNTLRKNNQVLRDENARLVEVLKLGREGLRSETW